MWGNGDDILTFYGSINFSNSWRLINGRFEII